MSRAQKCVGYDLFVKQHNPYKGQASFAKGIDQINPHLKLWEKDRADI